MRCTIKLLIKNLLFIGRFLVFVKRQDYLTVSSESNVTSYAGNRVIDPSERLDNLAFTNDEIPHQPAS